MNREQVLQRLSDYKKKYSEHYGIVALGVFGSTARGDAGRQSDVDIVVRLRKPELFLLAGLKDDLEKVLHQSIDIVVYRDTMNPFLRKMIDREAFYV